MIKVMNYRDNGGGEELLTENEQPLVEALDQLVRYELAFGGKVTAATETSLEVRTRVLACKDRTVFTGSVEEMEGLLVAAAVYIDADNKVDMKELVDKVSAASGGKPLIVAHAGPLIRGQMALEIISKLTGKEA